MFYKTVLCSLLVAFVAKSSMAKTITVHPTLPVKNIHQALLQAQDGDTILVRQARYAVVNLIIDKAVTLIGEDYPVLDGEHKDEILIIKSDWVTIKGFHLTNTNKGSMKNYAGIRCEQVKKMAIENNQLDNTLFPIYVPRSHDGVIRGNVITGNSTAVESGSGIYLWYSSHISIDNNKVSGQRDGIYFEFSTNCTVSGNICENNYRYGLHFMFSDDDSYSNNIFRNNGAGVAVMYSKNITMRKNRFENNWGPAAYGLLLKEINDSRIERNIFEKNTTGIFMESSSRNKFTHNDFKRNGWAMNVLSDCTDNYFNYNNFLGNSFDISTNGSPRGNSFDNNYWDKYTGYDLNKDNIGDVPYHPVSLYSKIIENIPYVIILLRSFVVDLLDRAERSIPSLIPTSVTDHRPLMKYKKS